MGKWDYVWFSGNKICMCLYLYKKVVETQNRMKSCHLHGWT